MDRQEIEEKVLAVLTSIFKCEVNLDSSRKNIQEWDSLKHIEIIFSIEDELGIQFSEDELAILDNITEIVDVALNRNET